MTFLDAKAQQSLSLDILVSSLLLIDPAFSTRSCRTGYLLGRVSQVTPECMEIIWGGGGGGSLRGGGFVTCQPPGFEEAVAHAPRIRNP